MPAYLFQYRRDDTKDTATDRTITVIATGDGGPCP